MKHIFLILHAYSSSPKKYKELKEVIYNSFPNSEVIIPNLKLDTLSLKEPDTVVKEIIILMDTLWKRVTDESKAESVKLIIIGHSMGALIARKLYITACGENKDIPFGKMLKEFGTPRAWASHVDRIILLAGINKGWEINARLYTLRAFYMRLGTFIGHFMRIFGKEPMIFKIKKGASFITELRMMWIYMLKNSHINNLGTAPVIQLLGTKDDLISPNDNIDVVTGQKFIYLEMPESNHMSVIQIRSGKKAAEKRQIFEDSINLPIQLLSEKQTIPFDEFVLEQDISVTDVVFVVHGIRDTGYWTQKIAQRVKSLGKIENRKFATETSTYGYFAMLPFLLPIKRRQKVEWLMDLYAENAVKYPNAEFSFVGHSNGTYLLAKSLKEYPFSKFKNIVFAGSVVSNRYNWQSLINESRVCNVFNMISSSDWVVAIFPKAFQSLKLQDIGSGGFDGFIDTHLSDYQMKFVKGGHSAAITETYWNEIAHFVVYGKNSPNISSLSIKERPKLAKILGFLSPIPLILILAALVYFYLEFVYSRTEGLDFIFFTLLYVWSLWKLITKY